MPAHCAVAAVVVAYPYQAACVSAARAEFNVAGAVKSAAATAAAAIVDRVIAIPPNNPLGDCRWRDVADLTPRPAA